MTSKLSGLRHQDDGGVLNRSSETSRAVEDADGSDRNVLRLRLKDHHQREFKESDPGAGLCLLASGL